MAESLLSENLQPTKLKYSEMGCDSAFERLEVGTSTKIDVFDTLGNNFDDCDIPADCDWSDASGHTISSCSWGDDEFERESAKKVKGWLEAIDDVLYEGIMPQILSEEVIEECLDWSKKYPYLRLKGEQITPQFDNWFFPSQNISEHSVEGYDPIISSSSLNVQQNAVSSGSKVEIKTVLPKIYIESVVPSADHVEEIIVQNGSYENCTAPIQRHDNNLNSETNHSVLKLNASALDGIKECVVEKLASHLWPKVSSLLRASTSKTVSAKNAVLLPPIIVPAGQRRASSRLKTQEEYQNVVMPDCLRLDGILTVSSKVLQKRTENKDGNICTGVRAKPCSGIPTQMRTTDYKCGSYLSINKVTSNLISSNNDSYNHQDFSKSYEHSNSKMDSNHHGLHMPILKEENVAFPSILQGVHIEPEVREALCKCKINDDFHPVPKPNTLLPPLVNMDHISNQKLTICSNIDVVNRNDSRSTGKSTYHSNSRPSTSMTIRSFSGFVGKQKKVTAPEKSLASHTNGQKQKIFSANHKTSLPNADNKSECSVNTDKRSLMLFPIVTSLEPECGSYDRRRKSLRSNGKEDISTDSANLLDER